MTVNKLEDWIGIIKTTVKNEHKNSYRVDVKTISDTAWRVNVYSTDKSLVPVIKMTHSYFVHLITDTTINTLDFNPKLGGL